MPDCCQLARWSAKRLMLAAWFVLAAALAAALIYPVTNSFTRLFIVSAAPLLWLGLILLTRRRRWLAFTILALGLLATAFLLLPGRSVDRDQLRSTYVAQLQSYEGTRYVWGGENRLGIDCSGLVRRALINADLRRSLVTANPGLLRQAISIWWHDCSARDLRDGYRHRTAPLSTAPSLNAADHSQLRPGDLAVTASGSHVLAYLGDRRWIAADPHLRRTAIVTVPATSIWFNTPVTFVRWQQLD